MRQRIDVKIHVRNNLRILRSRRKLTQSEVARKAFISEECYRLVESRKTIPNLLTALLIADAMGETIDKLFYMEKEKIK